MHSSLFLVASLIAGAIASPVANYVKHEKRSGAPSGWTRHRKMNKREMLPVKIALTQSNLHKIDEYLMDVSHPSSPNYGKHWDHAKIAETFAPSQDAVEAVMEWLESSGISHDRISKSQSLGWLNFDASVEETEELLKTEYHLYKHNAGPSHVACDEYHLPEHIQQHVDFITPTVHFDTKINQDPSNTKTIKMIKRDAPVNKIAVQTDSVSASETAEVGTPVETGAAGKIGQPVKPGIAPKVGAPVSAASLAATALDTCNQQITLECLRALYNFPENNATAPDNSYGISEFTPQAYVASDLDLFFRYFAPEMAGARPILEGIDGGYIQTTYTNLGYNVESNLDLEYAMSLVYPQNITLYQVGDINGVESFNTFLDALDAEYCTYLGGDDPYQDPQYPVSSDGFQGPNQCGGFAATKIISTSYGYNEADLTPFYESRQCSEYAKLGLAGTTFLFSSGDSGVAGNSDQCIDPVTREYNNGTYGIFNPGFPSGCPYITSVGATQIVPGSTVNDPEEACQEVIYSGGGFSNVFPLPGYQASAVGTWWTEHPPTYGSSQFNNSQATRGFPDLSANGANYIVSIQGNFYLVYGTSASSPTVGSILTLVNQERILAGKGPVGFINPVIYEHPEVFNDITIGNNPGCGTSGFEAVEGWDPVTGLGTPNYPKLLDLYLSLP